MQSQLRGKGLKIQFDIGTTMHPPLLPISQTSIFSTFKKPQTLDSEWFGGGSKNALKEIELPQLLSQILAAAAGPLSRMALGNEQDGNAGLFNLILNTYLKRALKIQTLVKTVHPTFHLVIVKKIMFF